MRPPLLFVGPYMGNRPGRPTTAGRILADLLMAVGYPVNETSTGSSWMARFAKLAPEDRDRIGREGVARAEVLFDVNTVVEHYLRVLEAAAEWKLLSEKHWPHEVSTEDHA